MHRDELFLAAGNAMVYAEVEVERSVADVSSQSFHFWLYSTCSERLCLQVKYQPKGVWLDGDVWKLRRHARPAL